MMDIKKISLLMFILIGFVFLISVVAAQLGYQTVGDVSFNTQYYQPGFFSSAGYTSPSVYWPDFDHELCRERQDFIVQVAPGGCSPAVVRSDLLEEQPVPVFCKIMLIQANPLIDVSRVKSIRFPGKLPEGVAGITYFPPRYNLQQRRDLADTPIDDNMGYFVVQLKQVRSEKDMPDWIGGNLTAIIDYDVKGALGIGETAFYVQEVNSEEWLGDYEDYSFWNGKGYIKTDLVEDDRVTVSVYRDFDTKEASVTLKKGETSEPIYLGGFYCAAGLQIKVDEIDTPRETALLQIDDQQIWVGKGDRILDGQCSVTNVEGYSGGGKVSISCPVKDGRFDLRLEPNKINMKVGETENNYGVGGLVTEGVYLGYVGDWKEGKENKKFVVFISDPWSSNEIEFQDKEVYSVIDSVIENKKSSWSFDDLKEEIKKKIIEKYKTKTTVDVSKIDFVLILKEGDEAKSISIYDKSGEKIGDSEKINIAELEVFKNKNWEAEENVTSQLAYEYYKESIENYKDVVDLYPQEKRVDEEYFETYAAEALFRAAELAKNFAMYEDEAKFLTQLYRDYPDSSWAREAKSREEDRNKYDFSNAKALVNLRDGSYFIDLLRVKKPDKDDLSVDLLIDGKSERLGLNEIHPIEKGSIQTTKIETDYVEIKYSKEITDKSSTIPLVKLSLDSKKGKTEEDFDGTIVKLVHINLNKQAKLILDSDVRGPRAYANFSFKIGIEKRGIKLSPEKTKEMIKNLEESIERWNDINEKLRKVVKALKGACFATAGILTVKNLFTGVSGKSMARKEVMTKSGGWNDFCEKEYSDGKYVSVEKCLLENNDKINSDVGVYAKHIEATNAKLEAARSGLVERTDILDFEGQVKDRTAMENKFMDSVRAECRSCGNIEFPKGSEGQLDADFCNWASFDDLKEITTMCNVYRDIGGSQVLRDSLKLELGKKALYAQNYHDAEEERKQMEGVGFPLKSTHLDGDNVILGNIYSYNQVKNSYSGNLDSGLTEGSFVQISVPSFVLLKDRKESTGDTGGRTFLVEVEPESRRGSQGVYSVSTDSRIFEVSADSKIVKEILKDTNNDNQVDAGYKSVRDYLDVKEARYFKQTDAKAYQNTMKDIDKLQVKYFDRAPYKGLPAEVPFDVQNGWYVELEYVSSGFGKPYDESGRAVNFYICNVGGNGLIEFKRQADDICRYYNGVSEELGFPGMSASESRQLVARARDALTQSSKYYGKKEAIINGRKFKTGVSFAGEGGRCSDFMSPGDCNLLFNVCDPVICPSSRCDLGGKFPVDNVIQTGIIGSLVLCLPNINEGIFVPVCLSGVHAGIEGFVSILEAERDCLNESLVTGRNIGICDEIKSIYMCEFFWRQIVPFADVIIPRLIESFFSQGTRGGGEYLTVQSAWENTQASIDYFKDEYAVNSFKAFNLRSTEEAGTEICKSFVSTRYPTDFDLLTEPDSPPQYHAWFDENIMTTATPYPTSHYKVYYHIYAGNDQGIYYIVYLKDISEEFTSKYVYTSDRYIVPQARGYIPKGEHVDVARDFTAPSGYKQLCININGQDECGFGKVSTSFAVDYISDMYAKEQAEQQITTSKECVAGTPSLYSLAQPNIQAGVEEVVEPELYNQGIVKVCSTYNPEKQLGVGGEYDTTNLTYDRWKDVGYCDDPTIRCWLDTDSVKEIIKNKGLEEQVLHEVDTSLITEGELTHNGSREIVKKGEELITGQIVDKEELENKNFATAKAIVEGTIQEIVVKLTELANTAPSSSYRAKGLLLLGKLYSKVANEIKGTDRTQTELTEQRKNPEAEQSAEAIVEGIRTETEKTETPVLEEPVENDKTIQELEPKQEITNERGRVFVVKTSVDWRDEQWAVAITDKSSGETSPLIYPPDTLISQLGYYIV